MAQALIEAAAEQMPERSPAASPEAKSANRVREAEELIRTALEDHTGDGGKHAFESQPSKSTAAVRHGQAVESESEYEEEEDEAAEGG